MWEEGPEDHSSSFGAVLGGLMMWFDLGFYDYKYKHKIDISHYVPISQRMIASGQEALTRLLPRESGTRQYDMSQLSLDLALQHRGLPDMKRKCCCSTSNRTSSASAACGGILATSIAARASCPANTRPPNGRWGWRGFPFVTPNSPSIGHDFDHAHKPVHFDWIQRRAYFHKAIHYFPTAGKNMTDDGSCVPEMYVAHQTGHNTPLAWAQSFHIISGQILTNLDARPPQGVQTSARSPAQPRTTGIVPAGLTATVSMRSILTQEPT